MSHYTLLWYAWSANDYLNHLPQGYIRSLIWYMFWFQLDEPWASLATSRMQQGVDVFIDVYD